MEVPQWLKNIWARPVRNNSNTRRVNNTTSMSPQRKLNTRLNANAPEFVPKQQLNPNAPAYTPSTGGKRRKTRKARKSRKSRSKGQRR